MDLFKSYALFLSMSVEKEVKSFIYLQMTVPILKLARPFSYKIISLFKPVIYRVLAQFQPRAGLTFAGLIGYIGYYLYLGVSRKDLQSFLCGIPDSHSKQISKKITINFLKNELFKFLLNSGKIDKLTELFQFYNEQNLLYLYYNKKPAIIVHSHLGPNLAAMVGLYKLGIRFLTIQPKEYYNYPASIHFLKITNTNRPDIAPYILKGAYNHLKNNSFILIAIDGLMGQSAIHVNFMQHQYPFQRGIASLHRLTGAPIIPISVEWTDNNLINFIVHKQITVQMPPGISQSKVDERLTIAVVKWLEKIIMSNPEQIRLNQLPKYL